MASLIGAQIYIRRKRSPKPVSSFYFPGPLLPAPSNSHQPAAVCSPHKQPPTLFLAPKCPFPTQPKINWPDPFHKGRASPPLSCSGCWRKGWRAGSGPRKREGFLNWPQALEEPLGREVNWDPGPWNLSSSFALPRKIHPKQNIIPLIRGTQTPILAVPNSLMLLCGVTIISFSTWRN